jgi:SAM-dependent methyltransferase
MNAPASDKVFAGSVPRFYQEHMVPLIFEPYARDLAQRVAALEPARVLEIAAGTGVVTRHLASMLPPGTDIVATDLNPGMIDMGRELGTSQPVQWRQADAMQLPFADAEFDVVVCQFGVMFFPDKAKAFAQARRVLEPGGALLFSVWDRIEENEIADLVTQALARVFPQDPPRFMARTPHGYFDPAAIERDLQAGGFSAPPRIETIAARSVAASPHAAAQAYCQGTVLRNEIEARDAARLDEATNACAAAIAQRWGNTRVDGKIQAHIVTALR